MRQTRHAFFLSKSVILCSNQDAIASYEKVSVDEKKSILSNPIEIIEQGLQAYLPVLAKRLKSLYGQQEVFWEQVLFFYVRDMLGATH